MVQSTRENVRQYPRYVISCFVWGTVYCVAFPALLYIFGEVVPITSIVGTPEAFYETLQIVRFGFKVIFTIGLGCFSLFKIVCAVGIFIVAMIAFWFFVKHLLVITQGQKISPMRRDFTFTSFVVVWVICFSVIHSIPLIVLPVVDVVVGYMLSLSGILKHIAGVLIWSLMVITPIWIVMFSWHAYPFIILEECAYPMQALGRSYALLTGYRVRLFLAHAAGAFALYCIYIPLLCAHYMSVPIEFALSAVFWIWQWWCTAWMYIVLNQPKVS